VSIPSIETHGVRLRAFRADDRDGVLEGFNDPLTRRYMTTMPEPFAAREAEWWISDGAPGVFAGGGSAYAIADPVTDRLLGGIGLDNVITGRGQAEVGYWVAPAARGHGTATRAVRALGEHAFGTGLARLELITHWENSVSQRVAMAAGFEREAARRGLLRNRAGGRDDGLAFVRLASDSGEPVERMLPDLPGGELTDGVVTLRPLGPGDVAFATELSSVPDVIAGSVPPEPKDAEELRRRCDYAQAHWLNGDRADLVVVDTATGTPTGDLGLFYTEPQLQQAMVGYSMLPAWRGRGYVTRAVELLALWAFAETAIARLIAGTFPDNYGSQRVLSKAGFKREAYMRSRLPGAPGQGRSDDLQFVLLAEDMLTEGVRLDG
jgi:RimJ/RimL family protein N-acetyltransferase